MTTDSVNEIGATKSARTTARPPLSPREVCAFETLVRDDREAASAVCFTKLNESAERVAARVRGYAALARARAADAAANEGKGNGYSREFAQWEASFGRSTQVAA